MSFIPENWANFRASGLNVRIHRHKAAWFVPNEAGEVILNDCYKRISSCDEKNASSFLARLPESGFEEYEGRDKHIRPEKISELWLHITNSCNLKCRHCLFSSSPGTGDSLSFASIKGVIDEAYSLGCRMFVLTGGEPFVHPEIKEIISFIIGFPDAHVAVLTNGILQEKMIKAKEIFPGRVHLQISLDGLRESHDLMRGDGSFDRTISSLSILKSHGFAFTISMCVTSGNYVQMPEMVKLAYDCGAENLHFMWYFVKGRGDNEGFVEPSDIFPFLVQAALKAEELSVNLDNISEIASRVFCPQGTITDGSSAAWETLAIGPDMRLYPSAATIGSTELSVGLESGLGQAWKDSQIMKDIRAASIVSLDDPFRFILGGGDFDHSYLSSGSFIGGDPYYELTKDIALWLIAREALKYSGYPGPGLCLKMGDILKTCGEHGPVGLCHSNCLLDLASPDVRSSVGEFYSKAASADSEDILNPVCYPEEYISHIPKKYRFRGYGCGSPVMDAGISDGFHVADLGSGRGIECFIAARLVGKSGKVTGIDMLDPMLERARAGAIEVALNLGYENVEFRKGFLENLPLDDDSCDIITSNCVLNLSPDKRRTFAEIFRVLKPGGRLVVSDVVCDEEPGPLVRNDEKLRGECIAGAMTQKDLLGILKESGFGAVKLIRRFPYRNIGDHDFYSLTFSASKISKGQEEVTVMYRGPFASVTTHSGQFLHAGIECVMDKKEAESLGEEVFILDNQGAIKNMFFGESSCCCAPVDSPASSCCSGAPLPDADSSCCQTGPLRHMSGCMICGARLDYSGTRTDEVSCHYCGVKKVAEVICEAGHFVCDACHSKDSAGIIKKYLLSTKETDMAIMLETLRCHPGIPVHGPEHHAMVAGIVVASYLNIIRGNNEGMIIKAMERGAGIAGGSCGFSGVCGAASGVGIGFAVILDSSPVNPRARKAVQSAVKEVLGEIARLEASRCCQRDSWIALKKASDISEGFLGVKLVCDRVIECRQYADNEDCIGNECPLFM